MPRHARIDLPGIAQHIVQRGNDRQPCFFTDIDRVRYLQDLRELTLRHGCAVHAYVLMGNHVHLLATPRETGQVPRLMQDLGRRYVRYVNDHYHRTGTLWEGRYKSCLVAGDRSLLQCQRYIELNPVRARMVADPADYRWSSHRHTADGHPDPLIHPHPAWRALGDGPDACRRAWRAAVMQAVDPDETDAIRLHLQRQHAYGPDRFRRAIEAQLGRPAGPRKIGRPRKCPAPLDPPGKSRL
ncbi:transposase [Lysobacter sp. SG-8]|uniref:Transposase n=1 Tax=Marilutibacter penaei TaxID=2759900 RepID=A0A7W3U551_9GAMM|nr:transposase [Lysobacter penaei]MBB1089108.1 transposase [Lysobacter penaei]